MFDAFFDAIARTLSFFYSLPVVGGSYGVAIILLTAAVMMVLMPLTLKATRSTIKMQEVQPKLKELQKRHKDDRQTLNAELMELYKENGINPVGGCLPMIAQLPVFLVLFNVLRGLSRRVSETPFFSIAEAARGQVGANPIVGETFDPQYLHTDSDMYQALSQDTEMRFGPFDLAAEARDVIQSDILAGIPYVVLILFVVGTSFYQQRQVSARRGGSMGMNPQQEMILRLLPLMSGIWSFVFPAGLVLYWATSNVFRIGQQSYITRAFYGDKADDVATGSSGDGKSSPLSASADADGTSDNSGDDEDAPAGSGRSSRKRSGSGSGSTGNAKASTSNPSESNAAESKPAKAKAGGSAARRDGRSSNGGSANGGSPTNGDGGSSREEAWAQRRERAKARSGAKSRPTQSGRVTPKGTKPGGSKKKRKR